MKFLTVLGVAQTACIVFLLLAVTRDESSGPPQPLQPRGNAESRVETIRHAGEGERLDESRLRRIIREELARHEREGARGGAPVRAVSESRNTANDQYRKEFVEQQIEYYRGMGEISPQQMQHLQMEIAKLDHDSRKEALSRLTRAMNAGEIKGQL